ncbi:MAG: hypothetical protein AB1714_18585 [Acidobacteriota bacterium]
MKSIARRFIDALGRGETQPSPAPGGFIDSLLQTFENCRPGLSDELIDEGEERVRRFFAEIYEKEVPRLQSTMQVQEAHLPEPTRVRFIGEVDELIRKVLIPAYARLACRYTPRERNDFYFTPDALHILERVGWCVAGMAVGGFIVWAPFIPLWSKEWVLPFAVGGLFFPNLRRLFAIKRYESELNRLVVRTDHEIYRIEMAYLTREGVLAKEPAELESTGAVVGEGELAESPPAELPADPLASRPREKPIPLESGRKKGGI